MAFDDPIMGLDLSMASIGWSVIRGRNVISGHVRFRGGIGDIMPVYRAWLKDMVRSHCPYVVAREAPIVGTGRSATQSGYCLAGATLEALRTYVGVHREIVASHWKSVVCGRGNISTAEKNSGMVRSILADRYGIEVDTIDEADAVCIALCMQHDIFGDVWRS